MTEIERIKEILAYFELNGYWKASPSIIIDSLLTTIESQNSQIESLKAITELAVKENEKFKSILERLPAKIMQLDSWADTEELTFPLTDPTEDNQLEWFDEFVRRLDDHVQSCFDGELYEEVEDLQT